MVDKPMVVPNRGWIPYPFRKLLSGERVVNATGNEVAAEDSLAYKGRIYTAADFPTLSGPQMVEEGFTYLVEQSVTDNDPTRTNTGQSFVTGDTIYWKGDGWAAADKNRVIELGSRLLHVDKNRVDEYTATGTATYPFKTVQAAVDAAESLSPGYANPIVILVAPGVYDETVTIKRDGVSLQGIVGQGACRVQKTGGPSLVLTNAKAAVLSAFFAAGGWANPDANYAALDDAGAAETDHPWDNQFRDLAFGTPAGGAAYCVMILGAGNGESMCGNEANFMRCHFAQNVYMRNANYIAVQNDCWCPGSFQFYNVAGLWLSRSQVGTLVAGRGAGSIPSDGGNYGLNGANAVMYGLTLNGTVVCGADALNGLQVLGNMTVGGDASFSAQNLLVSGTLSLLNTGGAVACTALGTVIKTLTDPGARLTIVAHT